MSRRWSLLPPVPGQLPAPRPARPVLWRLPDRRTTRLEREASRRPTGDVASGAVTSATDDESDPAAASFGTGSEATDASSGSEDVASPRSLAPTQPTLSATIATISNALALRSLSVMPARRAWSRSRRPITLPARRSEGPARRDRGAGDRAARSR